jgi:hypothetical protein
VSLHEGRLTGSAIAYEHHLEAGLHVRVHHWYLHL